MGPAAPQKEQSQQAASGERKRERLRRSLDGIESDCEVRSVRRIVVTGTGHILQSKVEGPRTRRENAAAGDYMAMAGIGAPVERVIIGVERDIDR